MKKFLGILSLLSVMGGTLSASAQYYGNTSGYRPQYYNAPMYGSQMGYAPASRQTYYTNPRPSYVPPQY